MNSRFFLFSLTIFFLTNQLSAQSVKIGVFDSDIMVQLLPGYQSSVDSVLQRFASDSLEVEYTFYQQEYNRLDSAFKMDSLSRKVKSILDLKRKQRDEVAISLINWERIAQYRIQQKRQYLTKPFYDKVLLAFNKITKERKYDLVLKPNTYESAANIENVFVYVAKELNVQLPLQLEMF